MKHLLCTLLIAFSLFSCSSGPTPITFQETAELHQRIATEAPPFIALILVARDTSFHTPNGVLVTIPAAAFVDEEGNLISGEVEMSITEVFSTAETVLSPISTVSTTGELLGSKGMVKIEATQKGRELSLGVGQKIGLTLPDPGATYEAYQLFYGVTTPQGTVEWEVDTTPSATWVLSESLIAPLPINFSLYNEGSEKEIQEIMNNGNEFASKINDYTNFTSEEMIRFRDTGIRVFFRLFNDGEFGPHTVVGGISEREKASLIRRFEKLPRLNIGNRADDIQGIFTFTYESEAEREKRILEADLEVAFQMSLRRLGWTNCDVFLRLELPVTNMTITRPTDSTLVKLVFSKYRTTVSPWDEGQNQLTFFRVPIGELVNVVAITPLGENVQLSVTPTTVGAEWEMLNAPETMSKEEMVQRLNALN